ncbi:MAG: hypothetical protein FJ100_05460 [Deltaproteobacteria bacterium]|nr:hypothetical protein [Deltaproteobacteria bacterium]
MATASQALVRPPIVARAHVAGAAAVEVRFFRLVHSLKFQNGRYVGAVEVDAKTTPLTLSMAAPSMATYAAAGDKSSTVYESHPIDALELVQRLAGTATTPAPTGARLVTEPVVPLSNVRHPLLLLQGDAAAGTAAKPGIGGAYQVLRSGHNLTDLATPDKRAPTVAWIHTDEYYWTKNGKGPLAPVFPSADVAQVFASNLAPKTGVSLRGGALLGRFALTEPKERAPCGWLAPDVKCNEISSGALPKLDEKVVEQVDTPWLAQSALERHKLAIRQPSARQVLFTAGLCAVRAEVWATPKSQSKDGEPVGSAQAPAAVAIGHFDFLARDPADTLVVVAHSNGDEIGLGRLDAAPYFPWVSIRAWLRAVTDDRASMRAPWAVQLPNVVNVAQAQQGKTQKLGPPPRFAPILCLMSCSGAKGTKQTADLLDYTEPRPLASGGAAAFLAVFATNFSRPVYQIGLPIGGTVAVIGAQAAVAGRAVGAVLAEIQGGRAGPAVPVTGKRAKGERRDTNNAMIIRALQLYSFWTAVLGDGEVSYNPNSGETLFRRASVGVVYSVWGVVNPGLGPGAEGFLMRAPVRERDTLKAANAAMGAPEVHSDLMKEEDWHAVVHFWEFTLTKLFSRRYTYFAESFAARKNASVQKLSPFGLRTGYSSDFDH